ncbi:MAG: aspartate aminotransferase family protein [Candidatus Azotimanducaceae bacterium]
MKLISVTEAKKLKIHEVQSLYRDYISNSQVELIGSFGFGQDLADWSQGSWIYTRSGKKVLDMTGGIGVLNHGHNHPRIIEARQLFQAEKRMEVHKNFLSPYLAALSHNVAKLMPSKLNKSFFPNSGAEAVEGAVKMAFKYHNGERHTLLHADISFHGKLLGAGSLTGSPENHFPYPKIPDTKSFIYDDVDSLETKLAEHRGDVYAVIIEPLNASSMRQCSKAFMQILRQHCDKEDIVLIFDEVYTGWGKTGTMFHFEKYCVEPDIVTYAKSFGGGKASISGYSADDKIFARAYDNLNDATLHSTTYYGFGEETVTAIEAVNICVEDDFPGKAREIGQILEHELLTLQARHSSVIKEIRGAGALWGLIFQSTFIEQAISATARLLPISVLKDPLFGKKLITGFIISRLYEEFGVLTYYGSNFEIPLKISPPLTVTTEEIKYAVNSLGAVLEHGLVSNIYEFVKTKYSVR